MANYSFESGNLNPTRLSNESLGYLMCAVSALEAWCNYDIADGQSNQQLPYRIADTIREDSLKENNFFSKDEVKFLWASVEGLYRVWYVLGEKIGLDNLNNVDIKAADSKNAREYVFGGRSDCEQIDYELNALNGRFESVAKEADELRDDEVNGEVITYLQNLVQTFDSLEFLNSFYGSLLNHPEFSAWLFSARCTIELVLQSINCIYSGKDMDGVLDRVQEICDGASKNGIDLQDERFMKFLSHVTNIVKKVDGNHLACAAECFPNKPQYQP